MTYTSVKDRLAGLSLAHFAAASFILLGACLMVESDRAVLQSRRDDAARELANLKGQAVRLPSIEKQLMAIDAAKDPVLSKKSWRELQSLKSKSTGTEKQKVDQTIRTLMALDLLRAELSRSASAIQKIPAQQKLALDLSSRCRRKELLLRAVEAGLALCLGLWLFLAVSGRRPLPRTPEGLQLVKAWFLCWRSAWVSLWAWLPLGMAVLAGLDFQDAMPSWRPFHWSNYFCLAGMAGAFFIPGRAVLAFDTRLPFFALLTGWWSWLPGNYWQRMLATEELLQLTRFLLACLKQGMPLQESVRSYGGGIRMDWLKKVFLAVASSLEAGASFSNALESQAAFFPASYIAMARAGEAQDDLPRALDAAARAMEAEIELKERTLSALSYPLVVGPIILAVALFMLYFVVPSFQRILGDYPGGPAAGRDLPWLSLLLFRLSDAFHASFPYLCGGAGAIVFGFWISRRKLRTNPLFLLPPIKGIRRGILEAHFCQTLGYLLQGGCGLDKALELAKGLDPDPDFQDSVEKTLSAVRKGTRLSKALSSGPVFSQSLAWACGLGEERGDLAETLLWLGGHQALSIRYRQERLLPWLERSGNILLGLMVGLYLFALMSPLFTMSTVTSNLGR